MLKLNIKNGVGYATFDGKTVKEVLSEIREFSKKGTANYLGDGFGNSNYKKGGGNWRISIDDVVYWNSWVKQDFRVYKAYDHALDNLIVKEVWVDGGFYSFYNFDIITQKCGGQNNDAN